ncbi:MAG: hypothetical protein AAF242_05955, partial [Bacteroidota bacterium]
KTFLSLSFLFCFLLQVDTHAQSSYLEQNKLIDGPANIHQSEHGKSLFSLEDLTNVSIIKTSGDWYKIAIGCFIKPEHVKQLKKGEPYGYTGVITKGSPIYNAQGKTIGIIQERLPFYADAKVPGIGYRTGFKGYTHQDNIHTKITKAMLLSSKSISSVKEEIIQFYQKNGNLIKIIGDQKPLPGATLIAQHKNWTIGFTNDYGWRLTLQQSFDYQQKEIHLDEGIRTVLIKVDKLQVQSQAGEKYDPNSQYEISIYKPSSNGPGLLKTLKLYADHLNFTDIGIELEIQGYGGVDDERF